MTDEHDDDDAPDPRRRGVIPPAVARVMAHWWRGRLGQIEAQILVETDDRKLEHLASEWSRISDLLEGMLTCPG